MATGSSQCHYLIHGFGPAGLNSAQEKFDEINGFEEFRTSIRRCSVFRDDAGNYTARSRANVRFSFGGRAWRVKVTQYNCANPSMTFPPFWSLLSFHRGGTETE